MRWMNLEPIIQSEVSQTEKNKYRIFTHMYGTQKEGSGEPLCRAAMETQTLRLKDTAGGGGEDGEGVEKREPSYTVGENANQYSHYGEKCGDSLKTGNRTPI